jgi:hypothetical protein
MMPRAGWSPKFVPYGADQTVYLVVDSFSPSGTVYRETEVERTDFETIIADFLTGQFNNPVRVIAFNTLEHWSDDVSEAIAIEIQTRCDIEGVSVPEHVSDFVDRYRGPVRQFALKLARDLRYRDLRYRGLGYRDLGYRDLGYPGQSRQQ